MRFFLLINYFFMLQKLVTADGSNVSDSNSQCTELSQRSDLRIPHERLGLIGDSRPPSFQ